MDSESFLAGSTAILVSGGRDSSERVSKKKKATFGKNVREKKWQICLFAKALYLIWQNFSTILLLGQNYPVFRKTP